MSDMEYTRAVLVPLTDTSGWSRGRILEAVRPILGEPTDIDEHLGEVYWFTYAPESERRLVGGWGVCGTGTGWSLRYTLSHHHREDGPALALRVSVLVELGRAGVALAGKAGLSTGAPYLAAYSWYNGVDEPTDRPDWASP